MSTVSDIIYTILAADQVYTNELTPVSAVPWNQRSDTRTFPVIPIDYSADHMVWDFGDGTKYTGISAEHVYKWPGTYTISLSIINSSGDPVKSSKTVQMNVQDMIPTQYAYETPKDVIDIPTGKLTNPIKINYMMSWQNYYLNNRTTPLCPDEHQHWMTSSKSPGTWMCGESHHGSTLSTPIYTFNIYASGAVSEPIDVDQYMNDKYSHLSPGWSIYSATPELIEIPTNYIDVTLLDPLTGATGDPNTYELIYYSFVNNEFEQVSPQTPGAVLVGLSGNATFYYKDDIPTTKDSNDSGVCITAHLDATKIHAYPKSIQQNQQSTSSVNTKTIALNNVKTRVNPPVKLSITSNGLNTFPINGIKWVDSEIHFVVTVQDGTGSNILDSTVMDETKLTITLLDSNDTPIDPSEYTVTTIENTQKGYYRGTIKCSEVYSEAKIHAMLQYITPTGYTTDAFTAWYNTYSTIGTTGGNYRIFYAAETTFDDTIPINNTSVLFSAKDKHFLTTGIIEDITLISGGSSQTREPRITITAPGTGAALSGIYDKDLGTLTDIVVLSGGVGYDSIISTIEYEVFPVFATKPVATLVTQDNTSVNIVAISLTDEDKSQYLWGLETGLTPRLVKITGDETIQTVPINDYNVVSTGATDIVLDRDKNVWISTDNYVFKISAQDMSLLETIASVTPSKIETDSQDSMYICEGNTVTKRLSSDYHTIVTTLTVSNTIEDIIYHPDDILYILDTLGYIYTVSCNDLSIVSSHQLSAGTYSELTTTIDDNIYVVVNNTDLYRVTSTTSSLVTSFSSSGSNIVTIAGDSRGYVWLSDDANQQIIIIDVTSSTLVINPSPTTILPGNINIRPYPSSTFADLQLLATGDHTGIQWLRKYGYIKSEIISLSGDSASFSVEDNHGQYNIRKINEDHDHASMLKSYALQPWLKDNSNLWDQAMSSAVGTIDSLPTDIGKLYHEKIANFVANNNDLDACTLDTLYSYTSIYEHDMQMFNIDAPPSLQRLIDMLSIPHKKLYGRFDTLTDQFDQYEDYTNPDRENLGDVINFDDYTLTIGEYIVAFELFSKQYTKIEVKYPTTGTVDSHGNIVNVTPDSTIVSSNTYPISAYTPYWQWDLVAPLTVTGTEIKNYYRFYKYNPTTTPQQVEGIINWSDKQTLLTPDDETYDTWSKDNGIVHNIIEHQLRSGLNMFN